MFGVDLRTLALFRICLGLSILSTYISLLGDFRALFTAEGVLPAGFYIDRVKPLWGVSVFLINDSVCTTALLFIIAMLCSASFIVGWKMRWSAFLTWLFFTSLQSRNPLPWNEGDAMLSFLTFWSIFLPLGDKYAWDAPPKNIKKTECGLATTALMVQVMCICLFTAYRRLIHPAWQSGRGLEYSLQIQESVLPLGTALLKFPALLFLSNYAALLLQAAGPLLLFIPFSTAYFRTIGILSLAAFQSFRGLAMDAANLLPGAMTMTVPFIPASWWTFWKRFKIARSAGMLAEKALRRPAILGPAPAWGRFEMPLRRGLGVLAVLFAAIALYLDMTAVCSRLPVPDTLKALDTALLHRKAWGSFESADTFSNYRTWYMALGTRQDGTQVDIMRNAPVSWVCPMNFRENFKNSRWKFYVTALRDDAMELCRPYFLRYLLNEWNRSHQSGPRVSRAELFILWQTIRPEPGAVANQRIGQYDRGQELS